MLPQLRISMPNYEANWETVPFGKRSLPPNNIHNRKGLRIFFEARIVSLREVRAKPCRPVNDTGDNRFYMSVMCGRK